MAASDLTNRRCKPCTAGDTPLTADQATAQLVALHSDWTLDADGRVISRSCRFGNYSQPIAFVNALAWVVHAEDHHPDLEVGYNRCRIRFSTHAIGGLSENDFICAARVDALLPAAE